MFVVRKHTKTVWIQTEHNVLKPWNQIQEALMEHGLVDPKLTFVTSVTAAVKSTAQWA